jgi:hypothetical protein
MPVEILYKMPSVNCYINENLIVYPMNDRGEPDLSQWNELENLASAFVNQISEEDDSLISDLMYWKVRLGELDFDKQLN